MLERLTIKEQSVPMVDRVGARVGINAGAVADEATLRVAFTSCSSIAPKPTTRATATKPARAAIEGRKRLARVGL